MTLPACAHRTPPRPEASAPAGVGVKVEKTPPADLLVCAERPAGMPARDTSNPGGDVLDGLDRVFPAFGRNADRFDRLIDFFAPGTCSGAQP